MRFKLNFSKLSSTSFLLFLIFTALTSTFLFFIYLQHQLFSTQINELKEHLTLSTALQSKVYNDIHSKFISYIKDMDRNINFSQDKFSELSKVIDTKLNLFDDKIKCPTTSNILPSIAPPKPREEIVYHYCENEVKEPNLININLRLTAFKPTPPFSYFFPMVIPTNVTCYLCKKIKTHGYYSSGHEPIRYIAFNYRNDLINNLEKSKKAWFIDLGAHTGYLSNLMRALGHSVALFEPNEDMNRGINASIHCYNSLIKPSDIKSPSIYDTLSDKNLPFVHIPYAVGGAQGTMCMSYRGKDDSMYELSKKNECFKNVKVETIDSVVTPLILKNPNDFLYILKVDYLITPIEVIKGMTTLMKIRPPCLIQVEYSFQNLIKNETIDGKTYNIFQYITEQNYLVFEGRTESGESILHWHPNGLTMKDLKKYERGYIDFILMDTTKAPYCKGLNFSPYANENDQYISTEENLKYVKNIKNPGAYKWRNLIK